jgi:hypothetical protein
VVLRVLARWRSFCRDRSGAIKAVLAAGRSPPEIAHQLGESLHNHFRTRGVTLTSFELRRLVAQLLALRGPPADQEGKPSGNDEAPPMARGDAVTTVDKALPAGLPPGYTAPKPAPSVPQKASQPPPSPSPTVVLRGTRTVFVAADAGAGASQRPVDLA